MTLLVRGGSSPRGWREWTLGIGSIAVALGLCFPVTRLLAQAELGSSAAVYLELAINRAWCGRYPVLTGLIHDPTRLVDLVDHGSTRAGTLGIRQLIVARAGSLEKYCAAPGDPFVMHEVSLVAVESALLTMLPTLTFEGLAQALAWLRLILLGVFGLCLLGSGCAVLLAAGVTLAATYLTVLTGGSALFSQYPFLIPVTACGVGIAALCLSRGWHRRDWPWIVVSGGLGVWAGFAGNLRTSLFPVVIAVSALFLWMAARDRSVSRPATGALAALALAAAAWTAGLLAFDARYIRPVRQAPSTVNSSVHGIAHPLVLGLAMPPNALSAREGIEWNDGVGLILAQRIDPAVGFLGEGYERALFAYYRGLWQREPGEMAAIYLAKFHAASNATFEALSSTAEAIFWQEKDGRWLAMGAWPIQQLNRVVPLPIVFVAIVASGWIGWRRRHAGRMFLLTAIGLAGALTFIEAFVILGSVVLWYNTVLLLCTVSAGLLGYQALLVVLWPRAAAVGPRIVRQISTRDERRSPPHIALHAGGAMVLVAMLAIPWLPGHRSPAPAAKDVARLDAAVGRALCRESQPAGSSADVLRAAFLDSELRITPVRMLVTGAFGSLDSFCASPTSAVPFERSTLMNIETTLLRLRPAISLAGIEKAFHYAWIASVFTVMIALTLAGYGMATVTVLGFINAWSLLAVPADMFAPSVWYSVVALPWIMLVAAAASHGIRRGLVVSAALAASAFGVSLHPDSWVIQTALVLGLLSGRTLRPAYLPLWLLAFGAAGSLLSTVLPGARVADGDFLPLVATFMAVLLADELCQAFWNRRRTRTTQDVSTVLQSRT